MSESGSAKVYGGRVHGFGPVMLHRTSRRWWRPQPLARFNSLSEGCSVEHMEPLCHHPFLWVLDPSFLSQSFIREHWGWWRARTSLTPNQNSVSSLINTNLWVLGPASELALEQNIWLRQMLPFGMGTVLFISAPWLQTPGSGMRG